MYHLMLKISPEYRSNVIDLENDGSLHANKPELLALATVGGAMPSPDLPNLASPRNSTTSCNNVSGTGCAHRVVSDATWTTSDVDVTFPCTSVSLATGDNAFIYTGAADTAATGGSPSVDAGLQLNEHTDNHGNPYLSVQGFIGSPNNQGVVYSPLGFPFHLRCTPYDPTVHMHYTPIDGDPTHVMLVLTTPNGESFKEGYHEQTAILQLQSGLTANTYCRVCEVKRVTSLGTTMLSPDGSFVGVANPSGAPTPKIIWTNAMHSRENSQGVVSTSIFGETDNPNNIGNTPPLFLCQRPTKGFSATEYIGINYTAGAVGGPGC